MSKASTYREVAGTRPVGLGTFRKPDDACRFRWDGRRAKRHKRESGLSPNELEVWRRHLVVVAVVDPLICEGAWWAQVEDVRAGMDPRKVAKAYSSGEKPQALIARLLEVGAAEGERPRAKYRLLNAAGVRAVTVEHDYKGRPKVHAPSPAFFERIGYGGLFLARRGLGRCLEAECDARIDRYETGEHGNTRRRYYCDEHFVATSSPEHEWRRMCGKRTCEAAGEALGLWSARSG